MLQLFERCTLAEASSIKGSILPVSMLSEIFHVTISNVHMGSPGISRQLQESPDPSRRSCHSPSSLMALFGHKYSRELDFWIRNYRIMLLRVAGSGS